MKSDDPRHGSLNGYINLMCRCEACRKANAEAARDFRAKRKAKGLPAGDPRHGKEATYTNYGCRCRACRDAWSKASRERLLRKRQVAS